MDKLKALFLLLKGFILGILSYIAKNIALLVGIVEAFAKLIAGIISLCPIKQKDVIIAYVDKIASAIKKVLYDISDKMSGILPPTS